MTESRLPDYLDHIREAAHKAREYVQGMDQSAFLTNDMAQDAVIRRLMVIGEATRRIMDSHAEFVEAHPEVPWRDMRTMRNRLSHGYDDINLDTVWDVTQIDLPVLLERLPPPSDS